MITLYKYIKGTYIGEGKIYLKCNIGMGTSG